MTKTSLFTSSSSTIISGILQLADDIPNYDELEFIFCVQNSNNYKFNQVKISTEAFMKYCKLIAPSGGTLQTKHLQLTFADGNTALRICFYYDDGVENEIRVWDSYGNVNLKKIYGLKYSRGSDNE